MLCSFALGKNFQVYIDHLEFALVRLRLGESYSFEDLASLCCLFMLGQCYSAASAAVLIRKGTEVFLPSQAEFPFCDIV